LGFAPCVALLGARQVGKTTLARQFAAGRGGRVTVFDLENTQTQARLSENPDSVLSAQEGLVIVDEIQRVPKLFEALRPVCDMPGRKASFLLLGSASWELVRGVSESLAGRIALVNVPGFSVGEVGAERQNQLWLRGGFPRAFLAQSDAAWDAWMESFFNIFIRRDVSFLGDMESGTPLPAAFERFWRMLAHCHGQVWNAADLCRSLGIQTRTAIRYRDLLDGMFMLRVLHPWYENLGKRLVKSPKIYFRDCGLLHHLLGISDATGLQTHPHYGASWEGFALEQTLIAHGGRGAWFYGTHAGAELDLVLLRKDRLWGFEFKCADAPSTTKSMHVAMRDLKLEHLYVVHPGEHRWPLGERITALPLREVASVKLEPK
jgi:predicted AAA+ superfamily ATPase